LDARAGGFDPRCADEDRLHRAAVHSGHLHGSFERGDLAAKGVAAHRHVDAADGLLAGGSVGETVRQHDHACAGAVSGQSCGDALTQRGEQAEDGG
jgi:hypothetical protein